MPGPDPLATAQDEQEKHRPGDTALSQPRETSSTGLDEKRPSPLCMESGYPAAAE